MTVYTVFFVTPDGSTPDFDVAEFASLPEACAGVSMMMRRKSRPCHAEIFVGDRQINMIPAAAPVPAASKPPPVAQSPRAESANFLAVVGAHRAAMDLAEGMRIDDPEGLAMLADELVAAGAACEEAFGWTPAFYNDVAAELRCMAARRRN